MLTLNRLITEIQTFVSNHEGLNTFVFGDPWEVQAKTDIKYPLLFCMVESSTIEGTSEAFTLQITVCDLERKDKSNTVRVLSDMKRYANHFITYFRQEDFADFFTFDESISMDSFVESFDDNCAGWTFQAVFKQPFEWDLCGVPYTGTPSPLSSSYVLIVDQDNNILAQLQAGDTYTVEVLQEVIDTINNNTGSIIDPIS